MAICVSALVRVASIDLEYNNELRRTTIQWRSYGKYIFIHIRSKGILFSVKLKRQRRAREEKSLKIENIDRTAADAFHGHKTWVEACTSLAIIDFERIDKSISTHKLNKSVHVRYAGPNYFFGGRLPVRRRPSFRSFRQSIRVVLNLCFLALKTGVKKIKRRIDESIFRHFVVDKEKWESEIFFRGTEPGLMLQKVKLSVDI